MSEFTGKKIALITGASSGLGQEYVRLITPKEADEIWAVARREDRLKALQEITSIPVRPIPLDLTDSDSIDTLEALLEDRKPHIHILINAAGFGKIGRYDEMSRQDIDRMIDLNCKAAVDITQISLPYMKKGDHIMEICSTAAFQPIPYLTVYAASKSFLYRYSKALRFELFGRGISVTAVCPYWVKDTEFIPVAKEGADSKETKGSARIKNFPLASRKKSVARISMAAGRAGLPVVTPGIMCSAHRIVGKLVPADIMMGVWELVRRG